MVAGEVESSCQLVVTFFFFFFFGLTLPNYRNKSGLAQPPLISTTSSAAGCTHGVIILERLINGVEESDLKPRSYKTKSNLVQQVRDRDTQIEQSS